MGIRNWWRNRNSVPEIQITPIIPVEEMDDEQKESYRQAAGLELEYSLKLRDMTIEQMITSARWVQTSLLLLNAGAAAALLQTDQVKQPYGATAGGAFVLGAILALLQAYVAIRTNSDAPVKLSRMAGYWLSVRVDLIRHEGLEREFLQYAAEVTRRARLPAAIGWASIVSFVIGCTVVAWGILP